VLAGFSFELHTPCQKLVVYEQLIHGIQGVADWLIPDRKTFPRNSAVGVAGETMIEKCAAIFE
jgi:hypothetical protein